jgi:diguanylate cyclase (GGDEF)-like protein
MLILVVDDSRTIRAGIGNLVARMGHDVIEAEDGERALELFRHERPDLVLIDVSMPVMDGYEATRQMRQISPDDWVPIIFLSSMEADQDLDRAIEAGGDDYLVKPVSYVVLNAKIRALRRLETMRRKLLDITSQLAIANRELERISRQDGLTGIANRRYFDSYMLGETQRAARAREPLSMILIDVDFFKLYNDCYGHQAGDECLRQIAGILRKAARRPADLPARYGGEEFAMVLPETTLEGAVDVAKSIQHLVAEAALPHPRSEVGAAVTLSLGISSMLPNQNTLPEQLIEHADAALYQAKHQGRNRFVVYGAAAQQAGSEGH